MLIFFKKNIIWLVFVFAGLIRFLGIEFVPPALNWDEVSHGYNAYSILKTGKDEWGNFMPAIFRAYGDYKLPVYIYLTAISEFLFGINPFAVRLPSILAGITTVIFSYFLTKKLFKEKNIAVFSAFLVAVEPWSLFVSRVALEANVALAFIVSGVYFFLSGLEKKNYRLFLGFFLLGLSVWTYNAARIFTPFLLIALALVYKKELTSKKTVSISLFIVSVILISPMLIQLASTAGMARYKNLQIIDEAAIGRIVELRESSNLPFTVERILFNRASFFVVEFTRNYLAHFSLDFLYLRGGDNYQFNIPNTGILHIVGLPFLIIGFLIIAGKYKTQKSARLIIIWLLIAPIASSLTKDSPHTLRSLVFLPIPMILTSLGLNYSLRKIKNYSFFCILFFLLIFVSFVFYYNLYISNYRIKYSWVWQYGYKDVVEFARENYHKYEKILVTKKYGEPHEFFLFYWPWDPKSYQNAKKIRYFQSNWYWVDNFDKFYFFNDWDVPKTGSSFVLESGYSIECGSCLLITSANNAPQNWKKLKTVNFLDGKAAFDIYEH